MYLARDEAWAGGGGISLRASLAPVAPLRPRPVLTVDLADAIGSRRWWRGLGTLLALLTATLMLAPPLHPLAGLQPPPALPVAAPTAFIPDALAPAPVDDPAKASLDLTAMLLPDEPLATALVRSGVGGDEAATVAHLVESTAGSAPASGTALTIGLGRRDDPFRPRHLDTLHLRARFDLDLTVTRKGGGFSVKTQALSVQKRPVHLAGQIAGGVFLSLTEAGVPVDVAQAYLQALGDQVNFTDLLGQARYDIVVERERTSDGQERLGRLLYAGIEGGERSLHLIQWPVGGALRWLDASSATAVRGGFTQPVAGHVTSGFGLRFHPILAYSRMHQGIDFAAPWGTPIRAATDGVVAYAGWHGGHGQMVRLVHVGGLGTGYAHMSHIGVAPGERVAQGQVIGFVGSTGLSTGPHLHFEVYQSGVPINPALARFASAPLLAGAELAAYRQRLSEILASTR